MDLKKMLFGTLVINITTSLLTNRLERRIMQKQHDERHVKPDLLTRKMEAQAKQLQLWFKDVAETRGLTFESVTPRCIKIDGGRIDFKFGLDKYGDLRYEMEGPSETIDLLEDAITSSNKMDDVKITEVR